MSDVKPVIPVLVEKQFSIEQPLILVSFYLFAPECVLFPCDL